MPVEIVTIVNSSGKVISNGKHIVNVLKEAKAAYDEKKAAVKAERAIRRSQTYDVSAGHRYDEPYHNDHDYRPRTHFYDDAVSYTSSRRSHDSKHGGHRRAPSEAGSALTESNLRSHTEVVAIRPRRRSPHAETAPRDRDMEIRPRLNHAATMPLPSRAPAPVRHEPAPSEDDDPKDIDMDLAYGSIPPDLADRVDLDPAAEARAAAEEEKNARTLMEKIEDLLAEAQCLHHTATHIIEHLQGKPEAAAAVALALAELSALLGKLSPSFLNIVKCGSPAIFGLLISPQFLIAAGLTVGVTVVMFGGWKIVKRIQNAPEPEPATLMAPMAFESKPFQQEAEPMSNKPRYAESQISTGMDEALVVEEELSTIESWRRGITPFGEDGAAELELISPEASKAVRRKHRGGEDLQSERSARTSRTHKSSKTTSKTHRSHHSYAEEDHERVARERRSTRPHEERGDELERHHHSHRSHHSSRSEHNGRIDRSEHGHRSDHSVRADVRAERTERSSRPRRSSRSEVRTIEDGRRDRDRDRVRERERERDRDRDRDHAIEVMKPKKENMLKSLFKKKKRSDEEVESRSSSSIHRAKY